MKPFKLPAWRKKQIKSKFRRKDSLIYHTVNQMEAVMKLAVNQIIDHYINTEQYAQPTLNGMFAVSDRFYRYVVTAGFDSAKEEKKLQPGHKRLAKGPTGIPKSLKDLEQVFRSSKQWPRIMNRSRALTERLRRQYLAKLRKKFKSILPKLESGELDPNEAKKEMMQAWNASKSRVETIFRTETTNYFGSTQVSFFDGDPEIIGFLFDSVRDTSRTDICKSRHGLIYRPGTKLLRENTPALHFNCRSHLIALANTAYNRKLLEDPDRDPSSRAVAPLPPGWRK